MATNKALYVDNKASSLSWSVCRFKDYVELLKNKSQLSPTQLNRNEMDFKYPER